MIATALKFVFYYVLTPKIRRYFTVTDAAVAVGALSTLSEKQSFAVWSWRVLNWQGRSFGQFSQIATWTFARRGTNFGSFDTSNYGTWTWRIVVGSACKIWFHIELKSATYRLQRSDRVLTRVLGVFQSWEKTLCKLQTQVSRARETLAQRGAKCLMIPLILETL